jgi:hypothetical protein
MKKRFFVFAIFLSIFSVTLNSCDKDEKDESAQEPETVESSFSFSMDGVTSTDIMDISVSACADGFFNILGYTPDGSPISITTGKILENETRSICSVYLDEEDYNACIADAGLYVGGVNNSNVFSPVSGTATRTSFNTITISGVLLALDGFTEHTFSVEATAGVVAPINCE